MLISTLRPGLLVSLKSSVTGNVSYAKRTIRPTIGPTGGITFQGWAERETKRVTDVCGYRLVLATGSASAKAAIARAEALSGRSVSRQAIAAGHHAHGDVWHTHK